MTAREAAERLGTFTMLQLCAELGIDREWARYSLRNELLADGVIAPTGEFRKCGTPEKPQRGRPAIIYRYIGGVSARVRKAMVAPPAPKVNREKRPPVEIETRQLVQARRPQRAGTGRRRGKRDNEMAKLVAAARRAGAQVSYTGSGHHRIEWHGQQVVIPSTPSDHRSLPNSRALLRRHGIPV